MSIIGNLLWWIFGGILLAAAWALAGLLLCITIIGIPFGIQCIKIGFFVLWPFGQDVEIGNFGVGGFLLNILWILIFGWEIAVAHLVFGLLLCVTIIGIPFGMQHFKLAKLALIPFGASIYSI